MKLKFNFKEESPHQKEPLQNMGPWERAEGNQAAGGDPECVSQLLGPQEPCPNLYPGR